MRKNSSSSKSKVASRSRNRRSRKRKAGRTMGRAYAPLNSAQHGSAPVVQNFTPALGLTESKGKRGPRFHGWVAPPGWFMTVTATAATTYRYVYPYDLGPFLKTQSRLYAKYDLHELHLRLVPMGGTQQPGEIVMSYTPDPAQGTPTSVSEVYNVPCSVGGSAGLPLDLSIPSEYLVDMDGLFSYPYSTVSINANIRQQYAGYFTMGHANTSGDFSYTMRCFAYIDIEFHEPCVENDFWSLHLAKIVRGLSAESFIQLGEDGLTALTDYVRRYPDGSQDDIDGFLLQYATDKKGARLPARRKVTYMVDLDEERKEDDGDDDGVLLPPRRSVHFGRKEGSRER